MPTSHNGPFITSFCFNTARQVLKREIEIRFLARREIGFDVAASKFKMFYPQFAYVLYD